MPDGLEVPLKKPAFPACPPNKTGSGKRQPNHAGDHATRKGTKAACNRRAPSKTPSSIDISRTGAT